MLPRNHDQDKPGFLCSLGCGIHQNLICLSIEINQNMAIKQFSYTGPEIWGSWKDSKPPPEPYIGLPRNKCSCLFLKLQRTTSLTKLSWSLLVLLSGNSPEQKIHHVCLWLSLLTSEWAQLIILCMVPSQVLENDVNTPGGL